MNGFIKKTVAGCFVGTGLVLFTTGCEHYRDLVDPCWPERYNAMARHSVRDVTNIQADKGHMLEQTVWNWHFETDRISGGATARLNAAGLEILRRISRTQPFPDFHLYLQNAQDIPYKDGTPPEVLIIQRSQLNEARMQAIHMFMATQLSPHHGGAYQIAVHDFAPPSTPGLWNPLAEGVIEKNIKSGTPQNFVTPSSSTGGGK